LDTSMSLLLLALLGWSLASCTRLVAYHTVAPTSPAATTGPTCEPETNTWTVRDECRSLIAERSQEYQLFFAEFDDQGWPFDAPRYGAAGQQIPIFIDNLRREVTDSPRGVSIVTFVHGWKHNASYDDEDVLTFRKVLTGLNHLENQTCHRKVIGLYVGWRG